MSEDKNMDLKSNEYYNIVYQYNETTYSRIRFGIKEIRKMFVKKESSKYGQSKRLFQIIFNE